MESSEKQVQTESQSVSVETVRHVATLASLHLQPAEEERMRTQLNAILGYIAELQQVDTADVPAMAQVSELLGMEDAGHGAELRPDEIRPSVDRAAVLEQAPQTDGRFFKVPKVIER